MSASSQLFAGTIAALVTVRSRNRGQHFPFPLPGVFCTSHSVLCALRVLGTPIYIVAPLRYGSPDHAPANILDWNSSRSIMFDGSKVNGRGTVSDARIMDAGVDR